MATDLVQGELTDEQLQSLLAQNSRMAGKDGSLSNHLDNLSRRFARRQHPKQWLTEPKAWAGRIKAPPPVLFPAYFLP